MIDLQAVIEAAEAHARMGERVNVHVYYHQMPTHEGAAALTLECGVGSRSDWECDKPLEDGDQRLRWYKVDDVADSTTRVEVAIFFREASDARA